MLNALSDQAKITHGKGENKPKDEKETQRKQTAKQKKLRSKEREKELNTVEKMWKKQAERRAK